MDGGVRNGEWKDGCQEERGNERRRQYDHGYSRVALQAMSHFLQIGTDVDGVRRLALKHNRADQDELPIFEPVGLRLGRGNLRDGQALAMGITPIRRERPSVERVNSSRYDVGGSLQRRQGILRCLRIVE